MSEVDRAVWNEKSRIDKERYDHEMQLYNHARKLSKSNVKDPNAPRRPMSAFLAFSNKRRASLKREHPTATNADLSKMLSKAWKELSPEMKQEYVQEEAELRAKYKTDAVVWRKKKAEEAKASAPKTVSEEKQDTAHSLKLPPSNVSAIDPNASVTSTQDQSTLLASLANIQNQGGMSYFPGASNYSSSNSDLLGALHNRVYGASNSIDAAILQNLSERIRLEQQLANQQSFQLQQQLASSITGTFLTSNSKEWQIVSHFTHLFCFLQEADILGNNNKEFIIWHSVSLRIMHKTSYSSHKLETRFCGTKQQRMPFSINRLTAASLFPLDFQTMDGFDEVVAFIAILLSTYKIKHVPNTIVTSLLIAIYILMLHLLSVGPPVLFWAKKLGSIRDQNPILFMLSHLPHLKCAFHQ